MVSGPFIVILLTYDHILLTYGSIDLYMPSVNRLVRVASKSGKKRLCRPSADGCGKPLAFRRSTPPFGPPLGWKAKPSSRAEGVGQGSGPRKGEAFPHIRRQSRFAILPFTDFNAAPTD